MANQGIRHTAKQNGIKLWQVADRLGIAETTLCRRLRHELPEKEQEQIISIILEMSGEVE